jgi:hypothetical protein
MYNVTKAKQEFWTAFGQYMAPILSEDGERVNWINYKTGIKHIYFRMDAEKGFAIVGIELRHPDGSIQQQYFEKFQQLKVVLDSASGKPWKWQLHVSDGHGSISSKIFREIRGVNVFEQHDWPAIISFLKQGIISLDRFWAQVKDTFS